MMIARWIKPRLGIEYLEKTPRAQFQSMAVLCLLYFLQVATFILLTGKTVFASLITLKGAILAVFFLVFLAFLSFIVVQTFSLVFWWVAKQLKGCSSFSQTRAAVVWSLLPSSLVGCFWMLLYVAFSYREVLGKMGIFLGVFAYGGGVIAILYTLIALVRALSEVNKISILKTLGVVVVGFTALGAMGYSVAVYFLSP